MASKNTVITILVVLLVLTGMCAYSCLSDPQFMAEMQAAKGEPQDYQQSPAQPTLPDIEIVIYGLLALVALWGVIELIKSEIAIPVFSIVFVVAIILGANYLYVYGDKNGDGKGDTQIVEVVHPVGDNPDLDAQYAEINKQNTKSNILNIFGIVGYSAMLLIVFVVGSGVGLLLHILKNNKDMGINNK